MRDERRWIVSEWMTDIPLCVPPSMTVRSAFAKMRIGHFRHLLVVKEGELVGMVTDRDLRRPDVSDDAEGWMDFYELDDSVHVADIMTRKLEVVRAEDPLSRAVDLFRERHFGALPVIDSEGRLAGILTTHDVIRATQELLAGRGVHSPAGVNSARAHTTTR
jgi:acetoin utilization protein AcuB